MSDLTEFLLARIAEDEATAVNVTRFEIRDGIPGNYVIKDRVLAEVEAKRRIVHEHKSDPSMGNEACTTCADWSDAALTGEGAQGIDYPCFTLRALAAVYADHPDYVEAWHV